MVLGRQRSPRATRSQDRKVHVLGFAGTKIHGHRKGNRSTESPYFLWVDQFDTLGLGKDTVIVTGNHFGFHADLRSQEGNIAVFRMPYPMPFYTRGLDGRIDDAKAGWKGRGIWATYSSYMPKFTETRSARSITFSCARILSRINPRENTFFRKELSSTGCVGFRSYEGQNHTG